MSRNRIKIQKALSEKGYALKSAMWEPVGHACEMSGPEGGWYIEYMPQDEDDSVDVILAYSTIEALEEIANLPELSKAGDR